MGDLLVLTRGNRTADVDVTEIETILAVCARIESNLI
jgi:hypothetical protein